MCPGAEQLLGRLGEVGYGRDRVVPLAFHVDYFNRPWKDPFSDATFSRREYQYSLIYKRDHKIGDPNYLYFTPMLMVDGREPMLGTDAAKARRAIDAALAEPPGVALRLALPDDDQGPRRKRLEVTLSDPSPAVDGRAVLVGVATYEDPVSTDVPSGENAGKTLVEHVAVRRLAVQVARPRRGEPTTLTVPVALEKGSSPARCGLAAFVQDEHSGRIHQAASVPWDAKPRPKDR
jgi:hypothetical protein